MRRVVITGMGMVSPLGNNLATSWTSLLAGNSGIQRYENDPKLQNQKPLNLAIVKNFQQKKWPVPHANSRQNSFAVCAADEAIKNAGLQIQKMDKSKIGICLGVIGSNTTKLSEFCQQSASSNFHNINRLSLLHLITSIPTGVLSVRYKTTGPSLTLNTACASGLSAVIQAAKYIKQESADLVLAGGVEDSYNPLQIYSSLRIQAMTAKQYQKPSSASRPFDRKRSGFVLGEGCGILVVQDLQHAKKRGANILAQISGYGESSDGHHLVKPMQSGAGQIKAMNIALNRSGLKKQMIDFIDTHATSTPAGDQIQANSIKNIFGALKPYICANKSAIGHTLGAAGALELIFGIEAMNSSSLPFIRNLDHPDVEGLNYIRKENVKKQINHFMKNSFGFGGVNISALLSKYKND